MGDSESKQFGSDYLGKLRGQLDKKAPVFNQSLFAGAGDATKNAWGIGTQNANTLVNSGGYGAGQQSAQDSLGGVLSGYGAAGDNSRAALSPVYGALGDIANTGGLTRNQNVATANTAFLGDAYGGLAGAYDQNAPGYERMRQGLLDDAVKNVGAGFTQSGRFGGGSYINDATEASLNAIAPLDYQNYTNSVNNKYRSLDSQKGIQDTIFGNEQAGIGNRLAALGGQSGVANSIFGNQIAALAGQGGTAGQQFGMGQTALGNQQGAIDALGQIGAARDANAQGKLLGQADLFDRTKNAELDRLLKVGSGFGGAASNAANEAPWWQQLLGGALGLGGSALSGGAFGG